MVNAFFWVAFGMITGWVIAILQKDKIPRRTSSFILAGAAGGLIGGLSGAVLETDKTPYQANPADIMFAVFGALILVMITNLTIIKRTRGGQEHSAPRTKL